MRCQTLPEHAYQVIHPTCYGCQPVICTVPNSNRFQHHQATYHPQLTGNAVQQMPPKRTLLLDKGNVTASNLLDVQQHHPQHQLHIEIEPLARFGMPAVSRPSLLLQKECMGFFFPQIFVFGVFLNDSGRHARVQFALLECHLATVRHVQQLPCSCPI